MSELPSNWVVSTFGELNEFSAKTIDPSKHPEEVFELYSVPSFPSRQPELPSGSEVGSTKQTVSTGDVLVSKINPRINRVWTVGRKADSEQIASSEWIGFRSSAMTPGFASHYFKSPDFRKLLCSEVAGVGGSLTRAQPKRVAVYPVPVAPIAEQTRIANQLNSLLSHIQACNDRFDAIPTLLKRFRQAITNAACSGELSAEWRGANDLKDWESQTLANVCNSITDGDHQAPPQADSGVPFITISAMNDGRLRLEKASRFVPQSYFDSLKPMRRPARGDMLFSVTGSIGIPALVDTDAPFTFQRHIAILKPNKSLILSSFIALVLGCEAMRIQVMEVATGTAQLTIPLTGIRAFVFNLPPIDEQIEIVRRVEALFGLADRIETRCTTARAQAQRLTPLILSKAFRGELVSQDSNDEPASALMARIAAERALAPANPKTTSFHKPRTRRTTTAHKETGTMTKSRHDDDVKGKPYLAEYLRRAGKKVAAEELFKIADLPIADFYKQLAWEVSAGLIKDQKTMLEATNAA